MNKLSACSVGINKASFFFVIVSFLMISSAKAFWVNHGPFGEYEIMAIHEGITKEAFEGYQKVLSNGQTAFLDPYRLKDWLHYNKLTDDYQSEAFSYYHCDRDKIRECTKYLADAKNALVNLYFSDSQGYSDETQTLFGLSLHMLQDFYSHTNHVDIHGSKPEEALGDHAIGAQWEFIVDACDGSGQPLSNQLVSGWFFTPCSVPFACNSLNDEPNFFFNGGLKCVHGNPFEIFVSPENQTGLNKDHDRRVGHQAARVAAVESTKMFLDSIVDSIQSSNKTNEEKDLAICRLLGVPSENCPTDQGQDSNAIGGSHLYTSVQSGVNGYKSGILCTSAECTSEDLIDDSDIVSSYSKNISTSIDGANAYASVSIVCDDADNKFNLSLSGYARGNAALVYFIKDDSPTSLYTALSDASSFGYCSSSIFAQPGDKVELTMYGAINVTHSGFGSSSASVYGRLLIDDELIISFSRSAAPGDTIDLSAIPEFNQTLEIDEYNPVGSKIEVYINSSAGYGASRVCGPDPTCKTIDIGDGNYGVQVNAKVISPD